MSKGKTPILTADEAGELLRSIETHTITGLRDRALTGLMVFTFECRRHAALMRVTYFMSSAGYGCG